MSYNIAIDGPAGAGKSTIAKAVAKRMNYIYVDTGAMYRAMALFLLRNHVKPEEMEKINEQCQEADITIRYENGEQVVLLNGENVNKLIRTEEVSKMASISSANANVRKKLVSLQQALAKRENVVMDGRDIGTCVLPSAEIKIYLTASVEVRAKRRFGELTAKGEQCALAAIEADIRDRDRRDMTRELSPLKQAEDAVLIDTSDMDIEEAEGEELEEENQEGNDCPETEEAGEADTEDGAADQAGSEETTGKKLFKKKNKADKKQDALKQKIEELEDRVKRQMAEFDNFRKRTDKEKTAMYEIGAKSVIEKILPVVDNFERGLASVPEEEKGNGFADGMQMIYKQLMTELENIGVKPIEAIGQEFDPDYHNAVMQVESEEYETGIVAQELQKGYTYRDSVVRHSMVAVVS